MYRGNFGHDRFGSQAERLLFAAFIVRFDPECVAKLFSRLKSATLMQERTQMRNIE